ncbi:LysR family transcriptional regulator [Hoeflea sp. TYP-13]|uniref:LysR family transcriptional regulator n=1 Tax=Hoeflea sp. TYP-13 TaxID=3230023 RepID=UPI0034C606E0
MNETNYLYLDGNILRTFLVILEESSVSRAADRLDVTQSAVSHTLAKLRRILGDPLFIRSGQGLTPTETALSLKEPAQKVLDGLKGLTDQRPFEPRAEDMHFVVAANDMQRDLIFPPLLRETGAEGVRLALEFIPSGVPSVSLLRDARCQLILTPLPPDAPDLIQRRLFSGEMMCYFDGSVRKAPASWDEYRKADHIAVRFTWGGSSLEVLRGVDRSAIREPLVSVSNFSGIPSFVKGSNLIATELDFMQLATLKDLSAAPLPFESESVSVYMVWHERSNNDPAHVWLRRRIEKIAGEIPRKLRALSKPPRPSPRQ